jgi:uncharacterized protein
MEFFMRGLALALEWIEARCLRGHCGAAVGVSNGAVSVGADVVAAIVFSGMLAFTVATTPARSQPLRVPRDAAAPVTSVSALLDAPADAWAAYVFAHGAGAGMTHTFMAAFAGGLAERGVATLRFQFPFMERGSKRPDPPPLAHATVRAAVAEAARQWPGLPLYAGGKSYGGRMTSQAQAAEPLPGVRGLVFVGFPLHPAGKPSAERAAHLTDVRCPMLFLQGTRDELASLELLRPVVQDLAPRARLVLFEDADHGRATRPAALATLLGRSHRPRRRRPCRGRRRGAASSLRPCRLRPGRSPAARAVRT